MIQLLKNILKMKYIGRYINEYVGRYKINLLQK